MTRTTTKAASLATAGLIAAGAQAPLPVNAQDAWPTEPITVVVGFAPGGGVDRFVRAMYGHFSDKIGVPVNVVNRGGAGSQLAAMHVLEQGDDCQTIFGSNISPHLPMTIIQNDAPYDLEDFAFINGQSGNFDLMFTSRDSSYESFEQLMTTIRDNPGEVSAAIIPGGSSMLNLSLTFDSLDIPMENVNVVSFSSGSQSRTTVAGNSADFTVIAAGGTLGMMELIRPLAVYRTEEDDIWDAPTIGDVVTEMGGEPAPILDGSLRGFAASAACRENHPDRFDTIVSAMRAAVEDPEVRAEMESMDIGTDWIGPEGAFEVVNSNYQLYVQYQDRLSE